MEVFAATLMAGLEQQLELIYSESDNPIEYSEASVKVLVEALEQLKSHFLKQKHLSKTEEIAFFREIKPLFSARLLYHNDLYNIEVNRPLGPSRDLRRYYRQEMEKLQAFAADNLEFYRYYRKGLTYLDDSYFVRGGQDFKLHLDGFYLQSDQRFSTSHDYKVARIIANDLLMLYLEERLSSLLPTIPDRIGNETGLLKWTGSKAGMVELAYALHGGGVFNNGTSELKDIMSYFGKVFSNDPGQFHRTFSEISERKTERTKFLNILVEKLLRRMDDKDGI